MPIVLKEIKNKIKSIQTFHRPDESTNVFIFSTPRSGSTWLMELIKTQPGFKCCDEPFHIRNELIRKYLSITRWEDLYRAGVENLFKQHIERIISGKLCLDPIRDYNPFSKSYHFITKRLVFKILHAGEDLINWFKNTFNGQIILLIRHPIPVSLSREYLPRLNTFIATEYHRHFSKEQLKYANKIIKNGNKLECAVLSWCFQNMVPLRQAGSDWTILSYEQLVLDPFPIFERFSDELKLPNPEKIKSQLDIPSRTTSKSDNRTKAFFERNYNTNNKTWLLEKWRNRVDKAEEYRLMDILNVFDIDVYRKGSALPVDSIWIN